jgi:hypothetical protein
MTTHPPVRAPRSIHTIGHADSSTDSYATNVVGTADQLANLIANHRTAGTLITAGRPLPVPDRPGHYQLRIRLREHMSARPTTRIISAGPSPDARDRRLHRRTRIAATIMAITGTIATLAATAAYLLGQLVELITEHLAVILGVGVLVVLLLAALGRVGACPGIHCSGCRHR